LANALLFNSVGHVQGKGGGGGGFVITISLHQLHYTNPLPLSTGWEGCQLNEMGEYGCGDAYDYSVILRRFTSFRAYVASDEKVRNDTEWSPYS
jgi:hypothetical protein